MEYNTECRNWTGTGNCFRRIGKQSQLGLYNDKQLFVSVWRYEGMS